MENQQKGCKYSVDVNVTLQVKENENDSLILLNNLSNPLSEVTPSQHIISTMAKVQGPWAFVFWQVLVKQTVLLDY